MAVTVEVPENIASFLPTRTPETWLVEACNRLPEMLIDHANCELKAASTALGFLYRYPDRQRWCNECRGWHVKSCDTSSRYARSWTT